MKPSWLIEAEKHLGLREVKGSLHAPQIVQWLIKLKAWWRDDETPWCGVFVAFCLQATGHTIPKHWYRAKGYLDWGISISAPVYGCIVIFDRAGGGHVGIVVGKDNRGRLMVLGGNQGDQVCVMPFEMARVAGYRYPADEAEFVYCELPLLASAADSSTNEA